MYYFLKEVDEFDTGILMGFETGVIDKYNPAPENSIVVNTEKQLEKLVVKSNKEDEVLLKKIDDANDEVKTNNGKSDVNVKRK